MSAQENKITPKTENGGEAIEMLRPEEKREIKKPSKRHGFRNFIIILLIIIVVVLIGIGATGIYNIPLVSAAFGFNKPKDLGVKYTAADLTALGQKIPLTITSERVDYGGDPNQIFSGAVSVDTQNTSAEITAFLNRFTQTSSPLKDIQVKMIEGGVEVSGLLDMYIKSPAYAKIMIARTGEKSVSINVTSAKLGVFSIPEKYLQQINDWANKKVNERMAEIPGFSMTQLDYYDGYDVFKGTVPATVKGASGGWTDLLLE